MIFCEKNYTLFLKLQNIGGSGTILGVFLDSL
jgi:hypothetical protein